MDPVRNPYAPGAGSPPPELAGRQDILQTAKDALLRVANRKSEKSIVLVGLRGVGKTVLLNQINDMADDEGFHSIFIEAHEGKSLPELLVPGLRTALFKLSKVENAKVKAKHALRVLKSFAGAVKLKYRDFELGIDPETGTADSGDLEADLPQLMVAVAEAAHAAKTPVALLVDELQYLSTMEFSALIMAVHRINQKNWPLIVIAAGLPQILGLAGNSKSYAERLFRFPSVGALEKADAVIAITHPATTEGVAFTPDAVAEILDATQCYPYFLQQWAYEAWNVSTSENITLASVKTATIAAIEELDQSFFKVRFDRCSPSEKRYMRALAQLGSGTQRSGEIAGLLGVKSTSVAPTRSALIKKGMIYSPSHGDTAFTVPLFDAYMMRAMPQLPKRKHSR